MANTVSIWVGEYADYVVPESVEKTALAINYGGALSIRDQRTNGFKHIAAWAEQQEQKARQEWNEWII